jgi:hypothetical protein
MLAAALLALTLSGCAGAVLTAAPGASSSARVPTTPLPAPRESAYNVNQAAARRDAAALLKRLRLPSAAVRSRIEPAGDNRYLTVSPGLDGDSAHALAYSWWTIKESPADVLAYVRAHPPAGSTASGSGSSGDSQTGTSSSLLGFQWPSVDNVLGERQLQVTVTSLGDGETGIMAEAQSDWMVLRSWSERVPSGVTVIKVTVQRAPKRFGMKHLGPLLHAMITGRRAVARAVALVNSLAVVQPVVIACPMFGFPAGSLTVTYGAGPAGPALARATVALFPGGQAGGGGECDPIGFSIRGRVQKSLVGATFAVQIEQLAGLSSH